MSDTITFAIGGSSAVINGPDEATDITILPNWASDLTEGLQRWSYQGTDVHVEQWAMSLNSLTLSQWGSIRDFFYNIANGPVNAFTYTHTDGRGYSARFIDGQLTASRKSSALWGTTLRMELLGQQVNGTSTSTTSTTTTVRPTTTTTSTSTSATSTTARPTTTTSSTTTRLFSTTSTTTTAGVTTTTTTSTTTTGGGSTTTSTTTTNACAGSCVFFSEPFMMAFVWTQNITTNCTGGGCSCINPPSPPTGLDQYYTTYCDGSGGYSGTTTTTTTSTTTTAATTTTTTTFPPG